MNVVLVDPSRTVLKIVTGLLEARDHEARAFTDAQGALDYIKSDPTVAALITSAELTSMSGIELCRRTRQLASRGRPIYVILMSSNRDGQTLIEALDNGADDFIGKPPVVEELYARLRAAERRDHAARVAPSRDDRSLDRHAQPARFFRARGGSLRTDGRRRRPVGRHVRHRPFQARQ
jgi:DNA-binding response OmpR family regulator